MITMTRACRFCCRDIAALIYASAHTMDVAGRSFLWLEARYRNKKVAGAFLRATTPVVRLYTFGNIPGMRIVMVMSFQARMQS